MYLAIQVQTTKEQLAIKSIQSTLNAFGEEINLHLLERPVAKFIGKKLKETKENIIPGYIIAELKDGLTDNLYHLLNISEGVIRVLHQKPISETEFQNLKEWASQGIVHINEPDYPKYRRDNRMLNRLEKALATPSISQAAIVKLKASMAKIREQHRQYQNYIRHLHLYGGYKTFTGRKNVLEFPLDALTQAKERLFDIPFGWHDPAQLAYRLWYSLKAQLE